MRRTWGETAVFSFGEKLIFDKTGVQTVVNHNYISVRLHLLTLN